MKTSYYSNPLIREGKYFLVPISNSIPKGLRTDGMQLDIIPDWKKIVEPYKQGLIDAEEYQKRYFNQLDKSKGIILSSLKMFRNIATKYNKEIVFLCFEKSGDFCHRHILAKWIEEQTGETVEELKAPESKEPTLW